VACCSLRSTVEASDGDGRSRGSRNAELRPRLSDGASTAMTCKIERTVDGEDFVVLRVSGRIDGETVDTLREVIGQEKGGLALDLTEVMLVDREAVRRLAAIEANGIELRNCPAYVREWIAKERDLGYGHCS
jgi:hypothetical protein